MSVEMHAWIRPIFCKLCGPLATCKNWSKEWVRGMFEDFFKGRREVRVPLDLNLITCIILHKVSHMLRHCHAMPRHSHVTRASSSTR